MARFMFGEMADELLLASARVEPMSLQEAGYAFRYANLETALRHMLGKEKEGKAA
jgi:NAD dependent epimerase/dehydratase family enzyme